MVVRRVEGRYQLIAGERRWRAAQRAGLARVPAMLRDVPEETALEMTLVENLQREDLNPVEQARAFDRLMQEFGLTQEEVAERTGKDRATIGNALRLLKLEEAIQDLLEKGLISAGHARALLAVSDPGARIELARKMARGGMTVRQAERLVTRSVRGPREPRIEPSEPNTRAAIDELQQKFGTKVLLRAHGEGTPGQLTFEFYSDADLMRLYHQFMN